MLTSDFFLKLHLCPRICSFHFTSEKICPENRGPFLAKSKDNITQLSISLRKYRPWKRFHSRVSLSPRSQTRRSQLQSMELPNEVLEVDHVHSRSTHLPIL